MKNTICILLILLLMLGGCAAGSPEETQPLSVGMFSYTAVEAYYGRGGDGVFRTGFRNTEPTPVENAQQALELAKNECVVEYDAVVVSYDDSALMYCICFYKENVDGGDQLVYLNSNGLTQLVVFGE